MKDFGCLGSKSKGSSFLWPKIELPAFHPQESFRKRKKHIMKKIFSAPFLSSLTRTWKFQSNFPGDQTSQNAILSFLRVGQLSEQILPGSPRRKKTATWQQQLLCFTGEVIKTWILYRCQSSKNIGQIPLWACNASRSEAMFHCGPAYEWRACWANGTNWKLKDSRRFDLVVFKYTLFEACIWNGEQNCIFAQPKKQILDAHDLSVRWLGDLGISNLYLVNQKVLLASSRWYPCGGIWVNYRNWKLVKCYSYFSSPGWTAPNCFLTNASERRTKNTTHQTRPEFFLRWKIEPHFFWKNLHIGVVSSSTEWYPNQLQITLSPGESPRDVEATNVGGSPWGQRGPRWGGGV